MMQIYKNRQIPKSGRGVKMLGRKIEKGTSGLFFLLQRVAS